MDYNAMTYKQIAAIVRHMDSRAAPECRKLRRRQEITFMALGRAGICRDAIRLIMTFRGIDAAETYRIYTMREYRHIIPAIEDYVYHRRDHEHYICRIMKTRGIYPYRPHEEDEMKGTHWNDGAAVDQIAHIFAAHEMPELIISLISGRFFDEHAIARLMCATGTYVSTDKIMYAITSRCARNKYCECNIVVKYMGNLAKSLAAIGGDSAYCREMGALTQHEHRKFAICDICHIGPRRHSIGSDSDSFEHQDTDTDSGDDDE